MGRIVLLLLRIKKNKETVMDNRVALIWFRLPPAIKHFIVWVVMPGLVAGVAMLLQVPAAVVALSVILTLAITLLTILDNR